MAARTPLRRTIRLVHWNAAEGRLKAARLAVAGYRVDASLVTPQSLRALRARPPLALVIDLTRLPMQGRDLALAVRQAKALRAVPLVFVEGDAAKVAKIRRQVPDAVFTGWRRIRSAVRSAIAHPPVNVKAPGSRLAGYSGTPLPRKLGVKPGSIVRLAGAPAGFEATLGPLPAGACVLRWQRLRRLPRVGPAGRGERSGRVERSRQQARTPTTVTLWFVRTASELRRGVAAMVPAAEAGGLWIVWPKRTSPLASDLSEADVRREGLAAGMVDFKICAVDATWSGLRFTRRKA